jgi:hypothetical protein
MIVESHVPVGSGGAVRARRGDAGPTGRDAVPVHQGAQRVGLQVGQRRRVAAETRHATWCCARQRAEEQLLQACQMDCSGKCTKRYLGLP